MSDIPVTDATTPDAGTSSLTVVAVHGNGGGAFRFSLMPTELADGVTLHAVTLPGFEGRPLGTASPTMATYTDDLATTIRGIDGPVVVLGHGIGGSIALDTLGRHPGIADGLILHAIVGANLDERWFPRFMARPAVRSGVQRLISSKAIRLTAGRLLFRSAPAGFADRFLAEYRRAESFGPMFDLLTAEWFDSLAEVAAPTVVLWGEKDRVLDIGQLEVIEQLVPNRRRHVEPSWGHFPMIDDPAGYGRVIAELARSLTTP